MENMTVKEFLKQREEESLELLGLTPEEMIAHLAAKAKANIAEHTQRNKKKTVNKKSSCRKPATAG